MSMPAMTRTDLLLLGLLLDRPRHGYKLNQQIRAEGIDAWFSVSAAGVYYSLGKLRDQGFVAESRQQSAGSSRKSIYRLTEEGRVAFFRAMEVELASAEVACLDYDLAIYLLNRLPWQRVGPQLERRRAFLARQVEEAKVALAAEQSNEGSPLKLAILDHKHRFLEMELDWLSDVIQAIRENGDTLHVRDRERQGLMILSGNLRDFHLPDLLHLVISGQHSGTLTVTDGAEVRILVFEDGEAAYAACPCQGELPPAAISCEQVMQGLCELFRWQEGRFVFEQKLDIQDWYAPLECSVQDLILRGCRQVDQWTIIQRLVPSADTIFELGSVAKRLDGLALTSVEERIMAAVDGVKGVATIARDLDLTLFEASRVFYCLAAIGALRTADLDKIHLRRVFREFAELMCGSIVGWRPSPDDRACEEEVNERCKHLPIRLEEERIVDRADPQLGIDELKEMYRFFLREQFQVVSRHFGRANADQAFERTLRHLAPELQDVAKRHGFDRVLMN